jgi:hypothetical protein
MEESNIYGILLLYAYLIRYFMSFRFKYRRKNFILTRPKLVLFLQKD